MNDQEQFIPHTKFGIKFISMGSMIDQNSPTIWRGPMLIKMLYNFLLKTDWGELDYLIIDTPPGTGDIHLTLCTEFNISCAILVTTAQKVAMMDVRKAFYMFEKLKVNVLGIVENMSYQIENNSENYLMGKKENTENFAQELGTKVIARIPFMKQISESFDNSIPAVLDLNIAKFYNRIIDIVTCTKK
jgi:ATP-binding protein involved in chromosome partitioning